jgi:hypothetical protein
MYASPALERFPSWWELAERFKFTRKVMDWIWEMAGGCLAFADGVNPYHRYNPAGATCGFPNG